MTFATKITVGRLVMVPVFAVFAVLYGLSAGAGDPQEMYRWAAFWTFVIAAVSDGVDGWVARRFHQQSELGAFLDPIADKALVLTAVLILTIFQWGPDGWQIPYWFAILVILRDCVIIGGIRVVWSAKRDVEFRPHWTGKIATFSLFFVLGWVMLRPSAIPPIFPCGIAAVFIFWSMMAYIRQGLQILRR